MSVVFSSDRVCIAQPAPPCAEDEDPELAFTRQEGLEGGRGAAALKMVGKTQHESIAREASNSARIYSDLQTKAGLSAADIGRMFVLNRRTCTPVWATTSARCRPSIDTAFGLLTVMTGTNLAKYLASRGYEPDDDEGTWNTPLLFGLQLDVQLLRCTHALYRAGWIHTDLTPENLVVDDDNVLRVIDFEQVRPVGKTTEASVVRDVMFAGLIKPYLRGAFCKTLPIVFRPSTAEEATRACDVFNNSVKRFDTLGVAYDALIAAILSARPELATPTLKRKASGSPAVGVTDDAHTDDGDSDLEDVEFPSDSE
jgi:serine/threonine protein kinase